MSARPKFRYYRSEKHLRNVASLPCQSCGERGTQAAHSNEARHGKGRGIKASDEFTAALCPRCHSTVDSSYHLTHGQRQAMFTEAMERTRDALIERGLWPEELRQEVRKSGLSESAQPSGTLACHPKEETT